MNEDSVAQRLHRFLLGVVDAIFVGTILELLLIGHHKDLRGCRLSRASSE